MKGVTKKQEEKKQDSKVNYDWSIVNTPREISEGVVSFDLKVNGITIYGMIYREYENKKGEEGYMISFPSRKGTGKYADQYFSHVWFPISGSMKEEIKYQLVDIFNGKDA